MLHSNHCQACAQLARRDAWAKPRRRMATWLARAAFAFGLAAGLHAASASGATSSDWAPEVTVMTSPCGPGATGSSLVTSAEGETWLSWVEPTAGDRHVLKCARFDAARMSWGPVRVIAEGTGWFVNWADFPVLAVQPARMTAVWSVGSHGHGGEGASYQAVFSTSADHGVTWSDRQPVTRESASVEFVALQPLPDGRVLAAWLDGRARVAGDERQTLYARVLEEPGPDMLVDERVCDCCQLSLSATADGSALLAYRGRTRDEIRDIRWTRFRDGRWAAPQPVHDDGWALTGCPVNGPQIGSAGEHVAAAWFTAAGATRRVLASRLGTGGFTAAQRIDLGRPVGRVDAIVLPGGAAWISWLEGAGPEHAGGIYLREISPRGEISDAVAIAEASDARSGGFPRMALLHGDGPPHALISFTQAETPSKIAVRLITAR
ncbi:hypothetical protein [Opitutus terrae]|nr:hypothetical protein [Opitutus terrae]